MPERKPPRKQCAKCPWKKTTNPYEIPNGYDPDKHAALKNTVADPGSTVFVGQMKIMACHESKVGSEMPCVGWLYNQMGEGNNIRLRLAIVHGRIDANIETVGEQHACLEDTLPKKRRRRSE